MVLAHLLGKWCQLRRILRDLEDFDGFRRFLMDFEDFEGFVLIVVGFLRDFWGNTNSGKRRPNFGPQTSPEGI